MNIALKMYIGEPCRICGEIITDNDIKTIVFAGYSKDLKSRTAHLLCYKKYPSVDKKNPRPEWKHQ